MRTFDEVILHFLKDMYYAERAILKSLPDLAAAAQNEGLKRALTQHAEETKTQVQRLEKLFAGLGQAAEGVTCEALVGLMQETDDVLKECSGAGPVRDAALVACAQAVEHYEVARYGALAEWLNEKGRRDLASLLEQSLEEEKQADAKLNDLAKREINKAAAQS
jgi:ferritin-like metal-binding protein YciE